MVVTINDILPVSICLVTDDLLDTRRFRLNFGDNTIMRSRDPKLEPRLTKLKRELNSMMTEQNFLQGHKTAIISNMDKILSIVSRYVNTDLHETEGVITNGKAIMDKIIFAESFEDLNKLEPEFKSKVMLPVYSLFIKSMRKSGATFL
jgi:hypothetical protein